MLTAIGQRLKEERQRVGLTIDALAKVGEASKRSQIEWEKAGAAAPNAYTLERYAKAGIDILYVVTGQRAAGSGPRVATFDADNFVMVPRYDLAASAGPGYVVQSNEQIVDYLAFKADWVRSSLGIAQKDLALISVKGDSMTPTLSDGDLVLIDTSRKIVEDSGVYVIRLSDTLVVKRVQRHLDGSLTVASDNPKYQPEHVGARHDTSVLVVGRVVWTGRRL